MEKQFNTEIDLEINPNLSDWNDSTDESRNTYVKERVKEYLLERIDDLVDDLIEGSEIEF